MCIDTRTYKGQPATEVVKEYLKRFPGIKAKDHEKDQWVFWQKAYPNKFTVKQARTPSGQQVVVF